jgi:hypothetical protein
MCLLDRNAAQIYLRLVHRLGELLLDAHEQGSRRELADGGRRGGSEP